MRLVELGPGDGTKLEPILRCCLDRGLRVECVLIDICEEILTTATERLKSRLACPRLRLRSIAADYLEGLQTLKASGRRALVLFLGSSIGNFDPEPARAFLRGIRRALHSGDLLLIGFDLQKDPRVLQRAYQDRHGITTQFNLNLLRRINRELDADFDTARFQHQAFYNPAEERMESWLLSVEKQEVLIGRLNRIVSFQPWEGIHVENSYKYAPVPLPSWAAAAGFHVQHQFFDSRHYFTDNLWRALGIASQ